jgi:hypothetical protein
MLVAFAMAAQLGSKPFFLFAYHPSVMPAKSLCT